MIQSKKADYVEEKKKKFRVNISPHLIIIYLHMLQVIFLVMLELQKDKRTHYVIHWKWKGSFESKLLPLHGAFFPQVKHFGYKTGIQFNSTPLVVKQGNYATKIVNSSHDLRLSKIRNFTLKIACLVRLI